MIKSIKVLNQRDQTKLVILGLFQVFLNALDLIGIALIGIVGSLSITGSTSQEPGGRILLILEFFNLQNFTLQRQVALLSALAGLLLVSKTLLSIYFSRKTMYFLNMRAATITKNLINKILSDSLLQIQSRTRQETIYILTSGVTNLVVGILGSISSIVADVSLVILMFITLLYVDPQVALITTIIFGGVLFLTYRMTQKRASNLGVNQAKLSILNIDLINEALRSFREIVVGGKRAYYVEKIGDVQTELATNTAKMAFLPNISKYAIEVTMVIGTLLIAGLQFIQKDAPQAFAVLAMFFAASSRIIPALLRIQQSSIAIRVVSKSSLPTLEMIDKMFSKKLNVDIKNKFSTNHEGFRSKIELVDVNLQYQDRSQLALQKISFEVSESESWAIIGKSGAGKSSLIDVILGIIEPLSGEVKISDDNPKEVIKKWPGAIAYVPQDIQIVNGSIRKNVCMGYEQADVPEQIIWDALRTAQLESYVKSLGNGLDSDIGDQGNKMSGGEKQRLGIARAILTKPRILVLDEATSALDSDTEKILTEAIFELKKETTVIMIAHRLTSVINMDKVLYMKDGKVLTSGPFEKVRREIPDFDKELTLLGF